MKSEPIWLPATLLPGQVPRPPLAATTMMLNGSMSSEPPVPGSMLPCSPTVLPRDLDEAALAAGCPAGRGDIGHRLDVVGAAALVTIWPPAPVPVAARRHLAADIDVARRRHQHRAALAVRRKRIGVHDPVQVHDRVDHLAWRRWPR